MNFIWNCFADPKGTQGVDPGRRETPPRTREEDAE